MTKDKLLMQRNDLPSRQADWTPTNSSTVRRINDLEEAILLDPPNYTCADVEFEKLLFPTNSMYEDKLSY